MNKNFDSIFFSFKNALIAKIFGKSRK